VTYCLNVESHNNRITEIPFKDYAICSRYTTVSTYCVVAYCIVSIRKAKCNYIGLCVLRRLPSRRQSCWSTFRTTSVSDSTWDNGFGSSILYFWSRIAVSRDWRLMTLCVQLGFAVTLILQGYSYVLGLNSNPVKVSTLR
jgi:hypothetical protein